MEAGNSSYKLSMLFKHQELLVLSLTLPTNTEEYHPISLGQVCGRGRGLGSDWLSASLEPCPVPRADQTGKRVLWGRGSVAVPLGCGLFQKPALAVLTQVPQGSRGGKTAFSEEGKVSREDGSGKRDRTTHARSRRDGERGGSSAQAPRPPGPGVCLQSVSIWVVRRLEPHVTPAV